MGNVLEINLYNKVVIVSTLLKGENKERLFLCESGRGCDPKDWGCDKIYGKWISTGKEYRYALYGYSDIIRLATEKEIENEIILED